MSSPESEPETAAGALRRVRDRLAAHAIDDAAVEAQLLLRHALRASEQDLPTTAWLYQRLDGPLDIAAAAELESLLTRRLAREPTAYITGLREFHGLDFEVTPDVLIPRPETELLVDIALTHLKSPSPGHRGAAASRPEHEWRVGGQPNSPTLLARRGRRVRTAPLIVDAGTGSGAIAVTLAHELPRATVIATDVSWAALAVARRNAVRHHVERRIAFVHGDLLLPVPCYADLIAANLPYVTARDWTALDPEVRDHEPALALRGGDDGLLLIASLLHQAHRYLRPGGAVVLEFGAGQGDGVIELAQRLLPGSKIDVAPDFAGIPRVLSITT